MSCLQETQAERDAHEHTSLTRSLLQETMHELTYPEPERMCQVYMTPCTAKELVLLAESAGWEAIVPAMLDMATRPDASIDMSYSWGFEGSGNTQVVRLWAGFKALQVLQSKLPASPRLQLLDIVNNFALFDLTNVYCLCTSYAHARMKSCAH